MTLDEIKWMTALFQTRNMSKAAEALFISQPALSQCVKRIEAQLGFPIFERSNKGLEPTEKGLLFARTALDITDSYQRFLGQVELLERATMQAVTIGMAPYLSACCSAAVLRQLQNTYPQIRFSVYEADFDTLLEDLQRNTIQLIVSALPHAPKGIKMYNFGRGRLIIYLRKGSPAARYAYEQDGKRYLDPSHLAGEPLALTKPRQASRRLMEELFQEAGVEPDIQQESQHISTLYRYAQEGIASSVVPLLGDGEERDKEAHLIYWIPESYQYAFFSSCILTLPEVDRRMPEQICGIIQTAVESSDIYIKYQPADGR